jgi:cytidylate kinase
MAAFSQQISVTSKTGVGSSTLLKNLKGALGELPFRFVSGGAIMRAFAIQNGMTIEQFAAHNRAHPEEGWDEKCDQRIAAFAQHNFVVAESRLGHAFMPLAFHVLLECDIDVCAQRRYDDLVVKGKNPVLSEVKRDIEQRDDDDDSRYEILYPGCLWHRSDFDLVINTQRMSPPEIVEYVLSEHQKWCASKMKVYTDVDPR